MKLETIIKAWHKSKFFWTERLMTCDPNPRKDKQVEKFWNAIVLRSKEMTDVSFAQAMEWLNNNDSIVYFRANAVWLVLENSLFVSDSDDKKIRIVECVNQAILYGERNAKSNDRDSAVRDRKG